MNIREDEHRKKITLRKVNIGNVNIRENSMLIFTYKCIKERNRVFITGLHCRVFNNHYIFYYKDNYCTLYFISRRHCDM